MERLANMMFDIRHWWRRLRCRDPWLLDVDVEALERGPEPDRTDPWATNEWQRTLVTPVFVGGPRDGAILARRPRHSLPLAIRVPMPGTTMTAEFVEDVHEAARPHLGIVTYRMGPYRDAFTVEYR